MYFQNALPHHEWDFHLVSDKIQLVLLESSLEFEVSDGERWKFLPGQMILLDDHSGTGHKVKTFERVACVLAIHFN